MSTETHDTTYPRITEKNGRLVISVPHEDVEDVALRVFLEEVDAEAINGRSQFEMKGELDSDAVGPNGESIAWLTYWPEEAGVDDRLYPKVTVQPERVENLEDDA